MLRTSKSTLSPTYSEVSSICAAYARSARFAGEAQLTRVLEYDDCDGSWGPLGKKCSRCRASRHACVELAQPPLIPFLNTALAAREELFRSTRPGGDQPAARAAFDDAIAQLKNAQRAYDSNKGAFTGDKPTPRKGAAGAAPAEGMLDAEKVKELQTISRGVMALAEIGREVSNTCREAPVLLQLTTCVGPAVRRRAGRQRRPCPARAAAARR